MRAESSRRIDVKEQKPRISPVRANTTPEHRVAVTDGRNEGAKARTLAEKARKARQSAVNLSILRCVRWGTRGG